MRKKVSKKEAQRKFTSAFRKTLKENNEIPEILDIARRNSQGRVWIIGGFVYRGIIEKIYGHLPPVQGTDVDFLLEFNPKGDLVYIPEGWTQKTTGYNNIRLVRGETEIDLNYLGSFHSIQARGFPADIKHFFTGTPLNVQSIAYELTQQQVIGPEGIKAIRKKFVKINNLKEAEYELQGTGKGIDDLVIEKAATELNFIPDIRIPQKPQRVSYREIGETLKGIIKNS